MKLVNDYLKKNIFIFKSGSVFSTQYPQEGHQNRYFEKVRFPIVIVAREHYQVHEKVYPIADKKDVKEIVNNQFQDLKMVQIQSSDLTSTTVRVFTFDNAFVEFAENNVCVFVPETMLCRFLEEKQLTAVERLGSKINLIVKSQNLYSAPSTGLYEDPEIFLMSSGVGTCSSKRQLGQEEYFEKIYNEIFKTPLSELTTIISGQVAHRKIINGLHFPSVTVGLLASIVVYWVLLWGGLQLNNATLADNSVRQDVITAVDSKRKLTELVNLALEQSTTQNSVVSSKKAWELITQLLENDISVGSLVYEKNQMSFQLLAESSTDTLELLRKSANVASVSIEGDIYDMYGKQQFKVNLEMTADGNDV